MIILHLKTGREIFLAAEHLASACVHGNEGDTLVYATGDGETHYAVVESPMDIARLRAAWELRFNASKLAAELPIAVKMDVNADGTRAIRFICCELTANLRAKQEAERKALLRDNPHPTYRMTGKPVGF